MAGELHHHKRRTLSAVQEYFALQGGSAGNMAVRLIVSAIVFIPFSEFAVNRVQYDEFTRSISEKPLNIISQNFVHGGFRKDPFRLKYFQN